MTAEIVTKAHIDVVRRQSRFALRDFLRMAQTDWRYPNGGRQPLPTVTWLTDVLEEANQGLCVGGKG